MSTLFWIFAAVWLLLQIGIPHISKTYGPAVKARFVERPKTTQPPGVPTKPITAASLAAWIDANPASAAGYASPVLFPLDFIFMFALSGALGLGSVWAASCVTWVSAVPWWVWWLFPLAYLLADFVEDVLLVGFLRNPGRLNPASFGRLSWATKLKIWLVVAAMLLFGALAASALIKVYLV